MSVNHPSWRTRADFRAADDVLLVLREPAPPAAPVPGQPPQVPANPAEGPEVLLAVCADGSVIALAGHVDLGTGLRSAYAQIVAEELDWAMSQVEVILGDTARAPNQGPTIASTSIQIHAEPLRRAAAQAHGWLRATAAAVLDSPAESLTFGAGMFVAGADIGAGAGGDTGPGPGNGRSVAVAELLTGRHVELMLDAATPTKPVAKHRLVGSSPPRVDIAEKVSGQSIFVHDVRLPGMLHGRVVRPPYAGVDAGDFVGKTLKAVDEASIAHLPGIVKLVVQGDFIGIVAQREDQAEAAMHALRVDWKPWPALPPLDDLARALSANPSTARVVAEQGDVSAARAAAAQVLDRDYVWPYQMHASIGPSCAVAHWHLHAGPGRALPGPAASADQVDGPNPAADPIALTVWAGTQNPHALRADLARLTGLADTAIDVIRLEASGCYGRNGADDVAADAALLARAVGAPVRVQLTREQEHAWEPKGAAQWMQVRGGLNADGSPAAYDFATSYPSNGAPTLALLLTRTIEPVAQAFEMGDRTAVPPYGYAHQRITVNDMPPILRASWLRGVSALPNSFAHESYIDELASAAGVDPVAYRLRYLTDARAAELVQATATKAGWTPHSVPQGQGSRPEAPGRASEPAPHDQPGAPAAHDQPGARAVAGDWLLGQGFAYARYVHSKFPGFGAAWAAWVADVEVNKLTGEVNVRRVVVGHDAGLMINPAGVQHQVHGNVLQTTSRALKERVEVDASSRAVTSREWGAYPILSFREVPVVEVMLIPRPGEPALGVGESASVPGTAAIANAIFDATGVRFRNPPFTPEVVRAGLQAHAGPGAQRPAHHQAGDPAAVEVKPTPARDAVVEVPAPRAAEPQRPRRRAWAVAGALAAGVLGLFAALLGWRTSIAPVALTTAGIYNPATLERGRQLAALGNCIECHSAPGGAPGAGGRPMATPFGTLHSTNLTPDATSGIGSWSFTAFQRAMREGLSRDGQHLYPAFPYTAFTRMSDDDLTALYAWLMAQPAVAAPALANDLRWPLNWRPLMALWNALYLQPGPEPVTTTAASAATPKPAPESPAAAADPMWQRGAYLVNGVGHCGACHTPRDAMGAEQTRTAYLGGAVLQGWEAPALGALGRAPVAWTEDSLLRYLRQGYDPQHGIAGGPMAAVVRGLATVDEFDVRAMAHYLVSLQTPLRGMAHAAQVQPGAERRLGPAQRLFEGACGACHHDGDGPQVLGLNLPLALNSNLHSERPDNLLRTILEGIQQPAFIPIGHMPSFRHALDDRQLVELAAYMRQRFAPSQPAWRDLPAAVARARAAP